MATYTNAIQKLYVAYFNRPADAAGLAYWDGVVTAAKGNTALVSATFAASAEYQAAYGQFTTSGVISQIYQNLFGHAPDTAGLAYWVKSINDKNFTIDQAVTQIADGALGSDKVAFNNKVVVATAFTAALDLPAEQTGYSGDLANAAAKTFLSSITTDASAIAALAPAALDASVAAVIKAGVPFSLNSALAALTAAEAAKTAFLVTADGDGVATTSATETGIAADVVSAQADVDALTGAAGSDSAGVKAAKLADTMEALTDAVADAQDAVTADTVAISKVNGLASAVANKAAGDAAVEAAADATLATNATLQSVEAAFNVNNGTTADEAANGTYAGLITTNTSGKLVLVAGVTETTNPGITALLAATTAHEAAEPAEAAAVAQAAIFATMVERTDHTAAADATLEIVRAAMVNVPVAAGTQPTGVQIYTEIVALTAIKAAADKVVTDAGVGVTAAQTQAATDAGTNLTNFNTKVANFDAADNLDPLTSVLATDEAAVETANTNLEDLVDAVAALDETTALAAQLKVKVDAIAEAKAVFGEHDFAAPVSLVGFAVGTTDADIFTLSKSNATVINFGADGDDMLFIGTDYVQNTGKIATAGNDAVLEFFLTQSGANTIVTLETKTFGSNSADAEIVITLTGVNVADVHYANGIITV